MFCRGEKKKGIPKDDIMISTSCSFAVLVLAPQPRLLVANSQNNSEAKNHRMNFHFLKDLGHQ